MEKIPSWVWVAGGGVLIVIIMMSGRSGAAVQTLAPAPSPDTSAQDSATIAGKYGLATTLINAAGTLDVIGAQGRTQAQHDSAVLGQLNAANAGQVNAINAAGYANAYAMTIGANRDISLSREATRQQIVSATRDVNINQNTNASAVSIASINADAAAKRDKLDAASLADQTRAADAANQRAASVASHQSDNDVWGKVAGGIAAVGVAIFGGLL